MGEYRLGEALIVNGDILHAARTLAVGIALLWVCALAWWDVRERRLPNSLTYPGLAVAVASWWWHPQAALGALAWGGSYCLVAFIFRGIGGGDVKLAPTLGTAVGWCGLAPVFFAMALASCLTVCLAVCCRALRRSAPVPHGPSMLLAALLVFAWCRVGAGVA